MKIGTLVMKKKQFGIFVVIIDLMSVIAIMLYIKLFERA